MNTSEMALLLKAAWAHVHYGGSLHSIEAQACMISPEVSEWDIVDEMVRRGFLKRPWDGSMSVYITIKGLAACLEGVGPTHRLYDPIHDHLADHTEVLWAAEA